MPSVLAEADGPLTKRTLIRDDSGSLFWAESMRGAESGDRTLNAEELEVLFALPEVAAMGIKPVIQAEATIWRVPSGLTLYDVVIKSGVVNEAALRSAQGLGVALAALHSVSPEGIHVRSGPLVSRSESRMPAWWPQSFADACRPRFRDFRQKVGINDGPCELPHEQRLTHGRAKLSFLVPPGRAVLHPLRALGWREAAMGDPHLDLATLLGDLSELQAGGFPVSAFARRLLDAYLSAGGSAWVNESALMLRTWDAITAHGAAFTTWTGACGQQVSEVERHCIEAARQSERWIMEVMK